MIQLDGIREITTERLRLRAPMPSDFEVFAEFMQSDRSRHVGGPVTRSLSWRGFCHMTGHWVHRGYSMFVVADRASNAALGMAGPWFPEGWPEPEIGWSIWDARAEGKGIAYEAALAARRFAYTALGWTTAISLIAEGNERSEALARRLGCTHDGAFVHEVYGTSRIFRHPGPERVLA